MHGPKKAKIANKKFNKWLEKNDYEILGKEFSTRIQSGGWPDYIVKNKKGKLEFFEVKSGDHKLDHHQIQILKILRKLGKVHIMRLDKEMRNFIEETPAELKKIR